MPTKLPVPVRVIIDLLSSSPPPQHTPIPAITIRNDEALPASSPLSPSPSILPNVLVKRATVVAEAKAGEAQESKGELDKVLVNKILDVGEVELPQPAAKEKRTTKATTDAKVRKPRTRKATEKSTPKRVLLKDGTIKSRVTKNTIAKAGTKSKYFSEDQQEALAKLVEGDQESIADISTALDSFPKNTALAANSPNQLPPYLEPPLHVIRRQWTPVKNTILTLDSSSPLTNGELKMTKKAVFGNMVDVMRYSTESTRSSREASASVEERIGNGLAKKRAIEMIGISNSGTMASKDKQIKPPKLRAPKKKPRTITDQATASYRTATDPTALPIQQFFSLQRETPSNPEDTDTQSSSSRKPQSPAKKKRKSDPETVILLSPIAAQKRFDDQDFVFGTSSQLEKDKHEVAPTYDTRFRTEQNDEYDELPLVSTSIVRNNFLEPLTQERKASSLFRNVDGEMGRDNVSTGHDDDAYMSTIGVRGQLARGSRLGKFRRTGSGLWGAAARDLEGGLMDIEIVDMTGSDDGDNSCLAFEISEKGDGGSLGDRTVTTGAQAIGRQVPQDDIEESCQSIRRGTQMIDQAANIRESSSVQTIQSLRGDSRATSPKTIGFDATLAAPFGRLANPIIHHTNLTTQKIRLGDKFRSISSKASSAAAAPSTISVGTNPADLISNPIVAPKPKNAMRAKSAPVMPDFQSYTTGKLKAEVAKFGFKGMRARDRMVSCLERCWEAQNKATSNLGPVENTAGLLERVTAEDGIAPASNLQKDTATALQKPKASVKPKKRVDKTIPKSPKHKATASKSKSLLSRATPPLDDDKDDTRNLDLSAKSRSPKKKNTQSSKPRTRKASAPPPPSPQYATSKTTQLHIRISEAVRESGRTETGFSFYHAVLMYDPIVLEDLVRWLNTYMKEEVDVESVKTWCEANGVCCVRSESLRGKVRKRR